MKRHISRKNGIMLRSMTVTLFMLSCAGIALLCMGQVYTVVEKTAYGRDVSAFSIGEWDYLTLFGKEIYFPVMTAVQKVFGFFEKYSSGLIKLLGFAINGTEELINSLFN